jgi:hypothetical protein
VSQLSRASALEIPRSLKTAFPVSPFAVQAYHRVPGILPPLTPPDSDISLRFSGQFPLPSLDSSSGKPVRYWPAVEASVSQAVYPASNTLPTPPTTETEGSRPQGHYQDAPFNVATAAVQHPGMGTSLDALNAPQSLTARRQAASHLPAFELPPPPITQFASSAQKHPALHGLNVTQPSQSNLSVGHLLTPPSNAPGENLSPTSSGVNSSNTPTNQGIPPYTPTGYSWPPTGTTPYGFGPGSTPQPWGAINTLLPPKGMFSPSIASMMRHSTNSPTTSDGLPPPPFDMNPLPPFPTSLPMSAPPSISSAAVQQHQQQQQQHQQAMANAMMSAQNVVTSGPTQASPVSAEHYGQKPPPTPVYGGSQPCSTPQHPSFPPAFPAPSPVQQSPMSASAPNSRISPISGTSPGGQTPLQTPYGRPYPSYSLPAMTGPIMTNLHSPGNQMSLIGNMQTPMMPGYNSGHAASMQHMYGSHPHPQQPPQNDRPFKCDQCPQSFNRNHDLKRHRRIHLAVKPFPCNHCDKSFSRKDALKVSAGI